METKPTYEQAQLHLQVYDLRRETRLRQARDWFGQNYNVETFDDAMRLMAPGTETGAFAGMGAGLSTRIHTFGVAEASLSTTLRVQ